MINSCLILEDEGLIARTTFAIDDKTLNLQACAFSNLEVAAFQDSTIVGSQNGILRNLERGDGVTRVVGACGVNSIVNQHDGLAVGSIVDGILQFVSN